MEFVLLVYDTGFDEPVMSLLKEIGVAGYTKPKVGSLQGDGEHGPKLGEHGHPFTNSAVFVATEEDRSREILAGVRRLRASSDIAAVRAFVFSLKEMV